MERFAIKIDKKLRANLYKICRLCGIDNPDMVPILTDEPEDKKETAIDVEAELEMSQKISLLIGLTITKDDRMPQTMCCLCVDKINDFYEFREMCYATNAQTRKLLGLKDVKKPVVDIKPKVEIKEETIVPTASSSTSNNKNANRKRKTEEIKEEIPTTPTVLPKKKLRFSGASEPAVKEEPPVLIKKKLRFTASNEEASIPATTSSSAKKSKNGAALEESKLKKELSPPITAAVAVSNKKLRLAAPPQKELANKKSKQKGGKNAETEVKEEIKEEIKEEPPAAPPIQPASKLKFGCNICKERFAAKTNLEAHIRTSHIPKIERYVCTACNEVLTKSFDIKNHQLWHKLSKTPYVCGCCGESIINTYAFSRHLREHGFETPPALLVLDRECPQCHTSYATNYLYNIHICAVKTKRCAGCNRLQRNEAEYLKHSAHCAKVYLNYSKHIMPTVEALEDAVRIKNENDVEAAAEEMARISGVPLDMAPVVQLTRLSSPLIMAASQCVSLSGLDDAASTSSKKSGKKGVSKKDLKRVDELLKSTLDALVSIKHEPEVHVEPETPCAGVHSDNDEHTEGQEETGADDGLGGFDDFHHNDNDTDDEQDANVNAATVNESFGMEQIRIKQEIDDTNEENANKMAAGGGLKLKIKKEHGQLNSSLIEQQKSEKKAEKRKKKKKHKDKEKDKQKLSKDMQDEQLSQDSPANNTEENIEQPIIRIKSEPQDDSDVGGSISLASSLPIRPQPEATIMTSIPMMQFQIACVSSGVEFNNGATGSLAEIPQTPTTNHDIEPEDVKPNREELDRMMKISHVSSGIAMETDETEQETEAQPMDHDGNYNGEEDGGNGEDHHADNETDFDEEENEEEEDIENNQQKIIAKKLKKPIIKLKTKSPLKPNDKTMPSSNAKSRNKACKSTAKPPTMPVLQISAVSSGVSLEPNEPSASEFTPIFIKPEPLNRGYADEQPTAAVETPVVSPPTPEIPDQEQNELTQTHTTEEQEYISSIDFDNITIKQEKDIEISDVQITQKTIKSFAEINGIKRKRKTARRAQVSKDKKLLENHEKLQNNDEPTENEMDEEPDTEEEIAEEHDEDEEAEEEEEEDEEEAEEEEEEEEIEEEEEEEEEREYRELEYPPQLEDKNKPDATEVKVENKEEDIANSVPNENLALDKTEPENDNLKENNHDSTTAVDAPAFVISSVCSQAPIDNSQNPTHDLEHVKLNVDSIDNKILTPASESDKNVQVNNQTPGLGLEIVSATSLSQAIQEPLLPEVAEVSHITDPNAIHTENTQSLAPKTIDAEISQVPTNEINLQLGQPFEVKLDGALTQNLNSTQESHITDTATTAQAEISLHNIQHQMSTNTEASIENMREDCKHHLQDHLPQLTLNTNILETVQQQENLQINLDQLTPPNLTETLTNPEQQTLQTPQQNLLEPVFTISSVTSAADLNITPTINDISTSNNQEQDILKDNQQEQETATIEGVVEQAKELNSEAQPITEKILNLTQHELDGNENEEDEIEEDEVEGEEDGNDNEPATMVDNNLEERQNYQNQEVLSHIRPAALALHPYLEDISSSSNSLLSNSLSQTPPPPPQTHQPVSISTETQRLLNTEETENILNESNDMLGAQRSTEVASTSSAHTAHLGQQLPTHMPTFNFDNINEIAENNNNANIEREQLQDEQQQQHHQQTTNNQ